MDWQTPEGRREYMRVYILARYHKRRSEAVGRLGGKCCRCGGGDHLQLDHINPATKAIEISKMWSVSKARFEAELAKCQVLCTECHKAKTLEDFGRVSAKSRHGTLSSYRYCKCDLCRGANAAASRARRSA